MVDVEMIVGAQLYAAANDQVHCGLARLAFIAFLVHDDAHVYAALLSSHKCLCDVRSLEGVGQHLNACIGAGDCVKHQLAGGTYG